MAAYGQPGRLQLDPPRARTQTRKSLAPLSAGSSAGVFVHERQQIRRIEAWETDQISLPEVLAERTGLESISLVYVALTQSTGTEGGRFESKPGRLDDLTGKAATRLRLRRPPA